MGDEAPAPTITPEPTDGALMDKAVEAIKAREPEPAKVEAKAETPKPEGEKPKAKKAPQAATIAAIAEREYRLTQEQKASKAVQERYAPLEEALGKKDLISFLNLVAERHGFTFQDFVKAMSEAPATKTPEQVAAEAAEKAIAKAREAEAKAREEAAEKDFDTKLERKKAGWLSMAESDGDRWELLAMNPMVPQGDGKKPIPAIDEVWDLIQGDWLKQRESGKEPVAMPIEQALDTIEAKLKATRDGRRKKKEADTTSAGGNGRSEAANGKNGRAAEPSFTQRNTSGVPGAVSERRDVDIASLPDHEAIRVAAARARIAL